MTDRETKSFDFAADLTKQLVTLSSSIVTVTLLFSKDGPAHHGWAKAAWVIYLISTIFGVWTLMALTGSLSDKSSADLQLGSNVRIPSACQIITFGLASFATIMMVLRNY